MTETTIKKYIPFGEPISPDTAQGSFGFIPNGIREKNIFFYHPDHLGSSSYITGQDGKVSQHTEYIAFGEILFDEHSNEHTMPYLFNGKELDQETNLTYFGARYLDMKTSLWLNTDPLSGYNPTFEHEHYIDGQHNGGVFNPMNLNTYGYTYQNPIRYIDPNGKQSEFTTRFYGWLQMVGGSLEIAGSGIGEYVSGGTASPLAIPIFLNGLDNYQAGFRQLWTGETTNTLLHTGTKSGAEALGASKQNAERIATAVDISTIFLGGGNLFKTVKALKAPSNASRVAEIAKANNIYSTQKSVVKTIIDKYYKAMKNGTYKSEGGAGFIHNGKIILTDGNHRMNAALKYADETGNSKYVEDIINKGNFQKANPSNYGYKTYQLPTSN